MTPKFDACLKKLLILEGGHSNDPWDSGGETWFGISKNNWPAWFFRIAACVHDDGRREVARQFYFQEFWLPMHCSDFSYPVAFELLEMAVNLGRAGATRIVQKAIAIHEKDIVIDGVFGPRTLGALKRFALQHERNLLGALNGLQFDAYREIVQRKPELSVAFLGWCARCASVNDGENVD